MHYEKIGFVERLANQAKQINSILQALAGLGELRAYLVQQTRNAKANRELIGLKVDRKPFLTGALKDILDGGSCRKSVDTIGAWTDHNSQASMNDLYARRQYPRALS